MFRMLCHEIIAHNPSRQFSNLVGAGPRDGCSRRGLRTASRRGTHLHLELWRIPKTIAAHSRALQDKGVLVAKSLDSGVLASRNWRVVRNNIIEISPSEGWITNGW